MNDADAKTAIARHGTTSPGPKVFRRVLAEPGDGGPTLYWGHWSGSPDRYTSHLAEAGLYDAIGGQFDDFVEVPAEPLLREAIRRHAHDLGRLEQRLHECLEESARFH